VLKTASKSKIISVPTEYNKEYEKSKEYIAYITLWYSRLCLNGFKYPEEADLRIPPDKWTKVVIGVIGYMLHEEYMPVLLKLLPATYLEFLTIIFKNEKIRNLIKLNTYDLKISHQSIINSMIATYQSKNCKIKPMLSLFIAEMYDESITIQSFIVEDIVTFLLQSAGPRVEECALNILRKSKNYNIDTLLEAALTSN
jgi:hypothetical protein